MIDPIEASVLFIAGCLFLTAAMFVFARTLISMQAARSHKINVDAQEDALNSAEEALDDINDHRDRTQRDYSRNGGPSDQEIMDGVLLGRRRQQPEEEPERTTMSNEEVEDRNPTGTDSFYRETP